ncbi:uncharacterized protein LOC132169504 [Corylus avellana]|uniref:uncharacterized protein LOC132169504 n=1 Tax=Corylus avellana TaxID=13451 RepID=UPI00286C8AF7|nr:uncharacterized protein LOC132169504 [Corylus avellana]
MSTESLGSDARRSLQSGRFSCGLSPSASASALAMAVSGNSCDYVSDTDLSDDETEEFLDSSSPSSTNVSLTPISNQSARLPTFHAIGQGVWCALLSYEACSRLCLRSWAQGGCAEAAYFLNDECSVLREAFGLLQVLLQSEEEIRARPSPEPDNEGAASESLNKCTCIAETVAYDFVLEVAMKVQHIKERNLQLHSQWKWLVTQFPSFYGVSYAYTKLRYLSYVMDVATPTHDCLSLVHDLLLPVIMKGKSGLSHLENRILGVIEEKVEKIITLVFENYKSLDESSPSGMIDAFKPATGIVAPALVSALKIYTLLHDILSPAAQLKLCRYFQAAARKRSRGHLIKTNESSTSMDPVTLSTCYYKMKSLVCNIRNEIFTDIEIHNQLPNFIDLPNISSAIYCGDLCNRLRAFLVACPPPSLSPPIAELVIATADFQRDLDCWKTNPVKGGVDAKELFEKHINTWIQDTRLTLLALCKLIKVKKWSGVRNQHSTNAFIEDMYDRLKEMMDEYDFIVFRWPEYIYHLEKAIADVEKAIVKALLWLYADLLTPLKDSLASKIYGLKYVRKIAKRRDTYVVSYELGIILNSMSRVLEILKPDIETKLNSWRSCIPNIRDTTKEDCFNEVTVMLRAEFRSYLHAVVEKLAKNTRLRHETKLTNVLQDLRETMEESDVKSRMQHLRDMLICTMDQLHTVVEPHVLIAICRGFWNRMGQDILHFAGKKREIKSYKGLRFTISILDNVFALEMKKLLGNALEEKDLEPPPNSRELHSLLY